MLSVLRGFCIPQQRQINWNCPDAREQRTRTYAVGKLNAAVGIERGALRRICGDPEGVFHHRAGRLALA